MKRQIKLNNKVFDIVEAYSILEGKSGYDSQYLLLEPLKKGTKITTTSKFLQFSDFQIPTKQISHIDFDKTFALLNLTDGLKFKIKCSVVSLKSSSFILEIKRYLDKETKEVCIKVLHSINEKLTKIEFIRDNTPDEITHSS